jgi:hypothetical protein
MAICNVHTSSGRFVNGIHVKHNDLPSAAKTKLWRSMTDGIPELSFPEFLPSF